MKVAGRALEIVALGLGQAGGNLAAEFARRGCRALAFNTAMSDLATLSGRGLQLPEELREYIGIEGRDGAGSDAAYGRECISAHAAKIRERVAGLAATADIVLITCGLGGGTGSSVAEMVNVLAELSLPLMVLATLPGQHESGVAKVNAVRAVNEVLAEPLLGWMFIDNARFSESHGNVSVDDYYQEINKAIVEPLDMFNRLNERPSVRAIRPLDGEDLRTVLLSGGLLSFGTKALPALDAKSVLEAVRECVQYGGAPPHSDSLENISYMGVVLEAPESMLSVTPFQLFEEVSQELKDETAGAAIYLGTYRDDQAQHATLRVVTSSQRLPEGLHEVASAAKLEGARMRDKLQKSVAGLDLAEIDQLQLFRGGASASRSRAGRVSPPPQSRVSEPPAAMGGGERGHAAAVEERKASDELIRQYKLASSEEERQRIAQHLNSEARSRNVLTRFYAVRAMAKLDPLLFSEALQAATHDEDSHVRATALRALQLTQGA